MGGNNKELEDRSNKTLSNRVPSSRNPDPSKRGTEPYWRTLPGGFNFEWEVNKRGFHPGACGAIKYIITPCKAVIFLEKEETDIRNNIQWVVIPTQFGRGATLYELRMGLMTALLYHRSCIESRKSCMSNCVAPGSKIWVPFETHQNQDKDELNPLNNTPGYHN